jgi:hypothetical protein
VVKVALKIYRKFITGPSGLFDIAILYIKIILKKYAVGSHSPCSPASDAGRTFFHPELNNPCHGARVRANKTQFFL